MGEIYLFTPFLEIPALEVYYRLSSVGTLSSKSIRSIIRSLKTTITTMSKIVKLSYVEHVNNRLDRT